MKDLILKATCLQDHIEFKQDRVIQGSAEDNKKGDYTTSKEFTLNRECTNKNKDPNQTVNFVFD